MLLSLTNFAKLMTPAVLHLVFSVAVYYEWGPNGTALEWLLCGNLPALRLVIADVPHANPTFKKGIIIQPLLFFLTVVMKE
jgi:hypothetical protein